MNRNLFGRIVLGSLLAFATLFVYSCKDYDDDIDTLQSEIDTLSSSVSSLQSQLSSLQSQVDAGNYVTGVSISDNVLTFTFSGGSSTKITLPEDEVGSIVTIVGDELYLNGVATGIVVASTLDLGDKVTIVDGVLCINGVATGVTVGSVSYADGVLTVNGVTVALGDEVTIKDGVLYVNGTATEITASNVTYEDGVLTVDGQVVTSGSTVTIVDGEIYVDGEASGVTVSNVSYVDGVLTVGGEVVATGNKVTVVDGELYIDGEATGITIATIKVSDGEWAVLQSDGTYVSTGVDAQLINVAKSGDYYYLYVYDEEGNLVYSIKLPAASDALKSIEAVEYGDDYTNELSYKYYVFTYNNQTEVSTYDSKWGGARSKPSDGTYLVSFTSELLVQLNPTSVDPDDLSLVLTDSENNTPSGVELSASAYTTLMTTRSANANGMHVLSAADQTYSKEANYNTFAAQFTSSGASKLYAVATEDGEVRSAYDVTVSVPNGATTASVELAGLNEKAGQEEDTAYDEDNSCYVIDLGTTYYFAFKNAEDVYDVFISYTTSNKNLFGITEVKDENGSVIGLYITKTPDSITTAKFDVTVYWLDKSGVAKCETITLKPSSLLSTSNTYALGTHTLEANGDNYADTNYMAFKLSNMKSSLTDADVWGRQMDEDGSSYTIAIYKKSVSSSNKVQGGENAISVKFTSDNTSKYSKMTEVDVSEATYMILEIDNGKAQSAGLELETLYYAEVTFTNSDDETLNTIYLTFTLTLPELTLGNINSNFYDSSYGAYAFYFSEYNSYKVSLKSIFKSLTIFTNSSITPVVSAASDDKAWGSKIDSDDAVEVEGDGNDSTIGLKSAYQGVADYYGKPFTLYISGKLDGWEYDEDALTISAVLLSPIAEGSVGTSSSKLSIVRGQTNDLTSAYVWVKDYSSTTYSAMLIQTEDGSSAYNYSTDGFIKSVAYTTSEDSEVVSVTQGYKEAVTNSDGTTTDGYGYATVKAASVSSASTPKITVTVTDAWGYTLSGTVSVSITLN